MESTSESARIVLNRRRVFIDVAAKWCVTGLAGRPTPLAGTVRQDEAAAIPFVYRAGEASGETSGTERLRSSVACPVLRSYLRAYSVEVPVA